MADKRQPRLRWTFLRHGFGIKYAGCRTTAGCRVWACARQQIRELVPRTDLINHVPEGFSWGSVGSGSAQLAIAILADLTGSDRIALKFYQDLKHRLIAHLPSDRSWQISAAQILRTLGLRRTRRRHHSAMHVRMRASAKTAYLRAAISDKESETVVKVRASGLTSQEAACRALLKLLQNPILGRQRVLNVHMELLVVPGPNPAACS